MNEIITFIIVIISILIGYFLGRGTNPFPKETIEKVKKVFENIIVRSDIGGVERPTARQVEDFNNPLKKAGDNEMSKTFSEIVER